MLPGGLPWARGLRVVGRGGEPRVPPPPPLLLLLLLPLGDRGEKGEMGEKGEGGKAALWLWSSRAAALRREVARGFWNCSSSPPPGRVFLAVRLLLVAPPSHMGLVLATRKTPAAASPPDAAPLPGAAAPSPCDVAAPPSLAAGGARSAAVCILEPPLEDSNKKAPLGLRERYAYAAPPTRSPAAMRVSVTDSPATAPGEREGGAAAALAPPPSPPKSSVPLEAVEVCESEGVQLLEGLSVGVPEGVGVGVGLGVGVLEGVTLGVSALRELVVVWEAMGVLLTLPVAVPEVAADLEAEAEAVGLLDVAALTVALEEGEPVGLPPQGGLAEAVELALMVTLPVLVREAVLVRVEEGEALAVGVEEGVKVPPIPSPLERTMVAVKMALALGLPELLVVPAVVAVEHADALVEDVALGEPVGLRDLLGVDERVRSWGVVDAVLVERPGAVLGVTVFVANAPVGEGVREDARVVEEDSVAREEPLPPILVALGLLGLAVKSTDTPTVPELQADTVGSEDKEAVAVREGVLCEVREESGVRDAEDVARVGVENGVSVKVTVSVVEGVEPAVLEGVGDEEAEALLASLSGLAVALLEGAEAVGVEEEEMVL